MPEIPRPNIESFANLVNEGLRPDVPQPASYWTAAYKTSEGFRETVLKTPFQTLGVYLISKAHEKYGGKDADTDALQGNNLTFANATEGFATMIGLKACDQTYREFEWQSLNLPKYDKVLNVIPHIRELQSEDQELKSVKYMRELWGVDTPPQPGQIDRLAELNSFMLSLSGNFQEILNEPLLFSHMLKAHEMGISPGAIDKLSSQGHMHHFYSAFAIKAQIQSCVDDYYQLEKAVEMKSSPILSKELIQIVEGAKEGDNFNSVVLRLGNALKTAEITKQQALSLQDKQRIAEQYLCAKSSWDEFMQEIQTICGDNLPPLAAPILFKGTYVVILQQHAHHLLLTRDDMKIVDKLARDRVIETQSPCATGDIIAFMDNVFREREL